MRLERGSLLLPLLHLTHFIESSWLLVNNYRNELIKWPPGQTLKNTTKKFEDILHNYNQLTVVKNCLLSSSLFPQYLLSN